MRKYRRPRRDQVITAAGLALTLIVGCAPSLHAQDSAEPKAGLAQATQPAEPAGGMPHLKVDRAARSIDLEGTVVLREGQWLELLACSPKSREHESILTVSARPSHIHLALLLIGLEPGAPLRWHLEGETPVIERPRGPRLAVSLIYQKDGKAVEVPASQWLLNQKTNKTIVESTWLFAGSEFRQIDNQQVYLADMNGSVISLVNFGDDLLTRDTSMTNQNDDATWGPNTAAIPPIGTPVTVRLKVIDAPAPPATQPATP